MFSVLTKTKRKSGRLQSPQAFSESWFSLQITAESRNKVKVAFSNISGVLVNATLMPQVFFDLSHKRP